MPIKINKTSKWLFLVLFFSVLLTGCSWFSKDKSKDQEQEKVEKKNQFEPNVEKRVAKYRDEGESLQNWLSDKGKGGTTYNFATSNVMWRATILSFSDIPLTNVDYGGGVIITDWFNNKGGNESIKITVNFLTNKVSASSFTVSAFKKTCNASNECLTEKASDSFINAVKEKIIAKIKELKIEEDKSKKKS